MQLDDGRRDLGPGSGDDGRTGQTGIKHKTIAEVDSRVTQRAP